MDKKDNQKNTVFNSLDPVTCKHLKPLSMYSRMITCEQRATLHQMGTFSNPFINFKIEVVNNCQKKRKLDDSIPDNDYETPAKKACSPKALSPDLGCFIDFCSPPARQDSLSTISKPALLDRTHAISSEMKETVSCQLNIEHVECETSIEPGRNKVTVPTSVKCGEVLLNPAPDFDCDVDSILCLNPFGTSIARGLSDNVESCTFPSSSTLDNKPVVNASLAQIQNMERGDWQVEEEHKERIKNMLLNVEGDQGYFSMSYRKDLELGKNLSQSVYPQLPPATSSPLFRNDVVKAFEFESQPDSSPEPGCQKQATLSGEHISFTGSDLCPIVSGPQLESVNFPVEPLEGDVEEVWNIGPPRFESSICQQISVELDVSSEQVSVKAQGDVMEAIHECQATLSIEETTLDTSYETTLPLVKVKSVVVVAACQTTSSSKQASLSELNSNSSQQSPNRNNGFQSTRFINWSQRPVVFKSEVDWDREKRLYVHSVTRHMNEIQHTDPDVVTELQNLMTHVADQTPGTSGRHWQHPSDLTRRIYQQRFGNMVPKITLNEWKAKSCTTHKRFNWVPEIFERSPFP